MATEIWEKWGSREKQGGVRKHDSDADQQDFYIRGTDDDLAVYNLVKSTAPSTFNNLSLETIHVKQMGYLFWEGTAHYGTPEKTQDGSWSFDTTGGTHHITQSLKTKSYGKAASGGATTNPDFKGAIGVKGDDVEGVDIIVPALKLTRTFFVDGSQITDAYIKSLARMTGKINSGTFRGFSAGELRFDGASGQSRDQGDVEIQVHFEASENIATLAVGDIQVTEGKRGWDYLWCFYDAVENGNKLVLQPSGVYVEQVYQEGDFNSLGIH